MADRNTTPIPSSESSYPPGDDTVTRRNNDTLITELINTVRSTEQQLKGQLERGQDAIERAMKDLDNNLTLNSCGILQSTGPEIDRLVAKRHDAIQALTTAAYYLGYEKPTPAIWK